MDKYIKCNSIFTISKFQVILIRFNLFIFFQSICYNYLYICILLRIYTIYKQFLQCKIQYPKYKQREVLNLNICTRVKDVVHTYICICIHIHWC